MSKVHVDEHMKKFFWVISFSFFDSAYSRVVEFFTETIEHHVNVHLFLEGGHEI